VAQLASKIIGEPMKANSDPPPAKAMKEDASEPSGSPLLDAARPKIADATEAGGDEEENDAPQQDGASS
jgi:hypothetical protein